MGAPRISFAFDFTPSNFAGVLFIIFLWLGSTGARDAKNNLVKPSELSSRTKPDVPGKIGLCRPPDNQKASPDPSVCNGIILTAFVTLNS